MPGLHHIEIWVADLDGAREEWGGLLREWFPRVNHLALSAGPASRVDALMAAAGGFGWTALYQERYPHAGGPQHYAGWLENSAGFKVELVADEWVPAPPADSRTVR